MIEKPRLPARLELVAAPDLEDALAVESCQIQSANWATLSAKRVTIDSVVFVDPDFTATKLHDGGLLDVSIRGGMLAGFGLRGCAVRRFEITDARADGMVLSESDVRDMSFRNTKLDLSNARYAKWHNVELVRCSLREVDFNGATLTNVSFNDCDLTGSDFSGAKLKNVDLRQAQFDHLQGLSGLEGAIMSYEQTMSMAPALATQLGIIVKDD